MQREAVMANRDPMYWVRLIIYVIVALILVVVLLFLLGVL